MDGPVQPLVSIDAGGAEAAIPARKHVLPLWARWVGWIFYALSLLIVGRIVYESTILTCWRGPQMVGFAMFHGAMPAMICLVGIPFLLASALWLLPVLIAGALRRFRFSAEEFVLIALVAFNFVLVSAPYSTWEHIDIAVCGPGEGGTEYLREFAYSGDLSAIQTLLHKGYSFDPSGPVGTGALLAAVMGNRMNVVQFMLEKGTPVNAKDGAGATALIASITAGSLPMTKYLLSQGAEPCARNANGQNAFDLAEKFKRQDAAALLAGFHCPARPPDPDITTCDQRSDCVVVH